MRRWLVVAIVGLSGRVFADPEAETEGGEEIVVHDRAPEETKAQAYRLSADDIATMPGAMNDALRATTALPSSARIPYSFGGVVLRGMSPRDSSVFLDGVKIPVAFHLGGITGVVPTQLLDGVTVTPSGADVSIGRTQGGVIELVSRTPRGDKYRFGGEVSLLHSLAWAEGPAPAGGAFLVALRRSYIDVLAAPFVLPTRELPSYADGQIRAVWGTPAYGQLTTYALGSFDRIANSSDAVTSDDGHTADNLGFVRAGASYKKVDGKDVYTIAPSVGANFISLYEHKIDTFDIERTETYLDLSRRWYVGTLRADWLRDSDRGFLHAGVDIDSGYLARTSARQRTDEDHDDLPIPRNTVLWGDIGVFAEARHTWFDNKLSLRPGVRLDRFGLGNEFAIDPRLSAAYVATTDLTLRGSLGRYHQPPSAAHFDEYADNLNAKSSYVDQATLAAEWTLQKNLQLTTTAFWNEGHHTLVDIKDKNIRPTSSEIASVFNELLEDQLGLYGYQANVGRERSYGVEGEIKYDTSRFRTMANVTWSRAWRTYETGGWVPYELDQPFRVNLLAATSTHHWNFGARVTIASGDPVNVIPDGTPYDELKPDPAKVLERLPTFYAVDVRIDRTWKRPWGAITGFIDLQNVTNHGNVESRKSGVVITPEGDAAWRFQDTQGLPIIPYIGAEFVPN